MYKCPRPPSGPKIKNSATSQITPFEMGCVEHKSEKGDGSPRVPPRLPEPCGGEAWLQSSFLASRRWQQKQLLSVWEGQCMQVRQYWKVATMEDFVDPTASAVSSR